ncbi:MAG: hypothetical protein NkDv07_0673 [Candidatus Improbicoccus devescovinae]|nr:MAG: hypothetical protein NkDv07_0673 [Candidatus Improbicoccus devescovinae]
MEKKKLLSAVLMASLLCGTAASPIKTVYAKNNPEHSQLAAQAPPGLKDGLEVPTEEFDLEENIYPEQEATPGMTDDPEIPAEEFDLEENIYPEQEATPGMTDDPEIPAEEFDLEENIYPEQEATPGMTDDPEIPAEEFDLEENIYPEQEATPGMTDDPEIPAEEFDLEENIYPEQEATPGMTDDPEIPAEECDLEENIYTEPRVSSDITVNPEMPSEEFDFEKNNRPEVQVTGNIKYAPVKTKKSKLSRFLAFVAAGAFGNLFYNLVIRRSKNLVRIGTSFLGGTILGCVSGLTYVAVRSLIRAIYSNYKKNRRNTENLAKLNTSQDKSEAISGKLQNPPKSQPTEPKRPTPPGLGRRGKSPLASGSS